MNIFYSILGALAAVLVLWYGMRTIAGNPQLFSRENFTKSFGTMGVLAIGLIAFIAILVLLLRSTG